jgi:hypothetical protein
MQSGFISHKGKKIYLANYVNLPFEEFEKEIKAVTEEICHQESRALLVVNDTTGLLATLQVINLFNWSVAETKPYVAKAAVVGIGLSGARKKLVEVVLKVTGQTATLFDDLEKAKDWLVEN